jgi:hypothetical protein
MLVRARAVVYWFSEDKNVRVFKRAIYRLNYSGTFREARTPYLSNQLGVKFSFIFFRIDWSDYQIDIGLLKLDHFCFGVLELLFLSCVRLKFKSARIFITAALANHEAPLTGIAGGFK